MAWSPQQDAALRAVKDWMRRRHAPQIFRLFGYAGTGKTTLAIEIAKFARHPLFASFTGKAALVMRKKGCHGASTIHSLIYTPEENYKGEVIFKLNFESAVRDADVVIIDECSMVGPDLGRDLESFGKRILVLGDPAQLPPIDGAGYFTERCTPDIMLTEIHRQAADNPIIALATKARQGERIEVGAYGESRVIRRKDLLPEVVMASDQLLVGMNKTRHSSNARIRVLRKFDADTPMPGERLVCLKNWKDPILLNGSLWDVDDCWHDRGELLVELELTPDEEGGLPRCTARVPLVHFQGKSADLDPKVRKRFPEFDYGYALTCHKAQGSQWDKVCVIDESGVFREDAHRWLYTAITRAAVQLVVARDV
jgi:exodeoxyribonuclease-5